MNSFCLSLVPNFPGWWAFIYCFVCFTMAGIAGDVAVIMQVAVLLSLNTMCYISLGAVIGILSSSVPIGMITSTILSQTSMVAAGFYTTLPPVIDLIRFVSPVYWTFKGIAKSAYHWSDTFECVKGSGQVGANQCFLEFSVGIDSLKTRGINVATYGDPSSEKIFVEILVLILLYVVMQTFILLYYTFRYNRLRFS